MELSRAVGGGEGEDIGSEMIIFEGRWIAHGHQNVLSSSKLNGKTVPDSIEPDTKAGGVALKTQAELESCKLESRPIYPSYQVDSGRSMVRIFGIISFSLFFSSSVAFKLNVSSARSDKYKADPAYAMIPRPMMILVRGVRARYFLSEVSNCSKTRSE